jgi:hypothetical protein
MSLICVPIAVEAAGEIPLALERAARARSTDEPAVQR